VYRSRRVFSGKKDLDSGRISRWDILSGDRTRRAGLGCLLPGEHRKIAVAGLHDALVVRAHGVRHEQPHLLESLEGAVAVEFRLPIGLEQAHVPFVGSSARLLTLLNSLGGSA
jgi:hypothetical protein